MDMSIISIVLVALIAIIGITYVIMQRNSVTKLNNALKAKNYDEVMNIAKSSSAQRFLGKDNCSLYYLKAMYLGKGKEATKTGLREFLEDDGIKVETKEKVLDVYFHIYLHSLDREFCKELLVFMEEYIGPMYYRYQKWSYDVILDKNPNHIEEMEDAINHNELTGFALGIATFMIGMSYYIKEDYEIAREWTFTAIDTFLPDNMYYDKSKKITNELTKIIGDGKYIVE